jgi:prephenate dehydratase
MDSYPAPALTKVKEMTAIAIAEPARAVAFQGAPGANSHLAALEFDPECHPLPCFSFEDAIDAVKDRSKTPSMAVLRTSIFCCPNQGLASLPNISCRSATA